MDRWESYKDYEARSTWYEQQEAKFLEEFSTFPIFREFVKHNKKTKIIPTDRLIEYKGYKALLTRLKTGNWDSEYWDEVEIILTSDLLNIKSIPMGEYNPDVKVIENIYEKYFKIVVDNELKKISVSNAT